MKLRIVIAAVILLGALGALLHSDSVGNPPQLYQNGGSNIGAAPYFNCGTGMSCTKSGNVINATATGTGGASTCTGSSGQILTADGSSSNCAGVATGTGILTALGVNVGTAGAPVISGSANTAGTAFTLNTSGATGNNAIRVPVQLGLTCTASGCIGEDFTGANYHSRSGGVDSILVSVPVSSLPTNGDGVEWVVTGGNIALQDTGSGAGIPTGAAGGVLSGTYPNPGLSASPQALPNGWTATTQSACDNSTKLATTAYVGLSCSQVQTSGSPFTLTSQGQTQWNNTAGAYVWNLPAPTASGPPICIGNYRARTGAISVVPSSGTNIVYKGVVGTTSSSTGLVSGGAAGDFICVQAVDSTTWEAIGPGQGTFTNN